MSKKRYEKQGVWRRMQKDRTKERIRLSNEAVANGLPPDPWVVAYRIKNNAIKATWKVKQPKKEPQKITYSKGWFKKGHTLNHILSPEEKIESIERGKEGVKKWSAENRERLNKRLRDKRVSDPAFKIKCNLRKRLSTLLRLSITKKTEQTMSLLGCTMPEFMEHLREQFKDGMTFENYGSEWHIDHILPCSSFDLTKPVDRKICFHYSNMQPLWDYENRKKSDRIFFNEDGSREGYEVAKRKRPKTSILGYLRVTKSIA